MPSNQFPLEEIARLPEIYHPTVAPDGSAIAYFFDGTGRNELYVDFLDGDGPEQLSDGEVPRSARWWPRWRGDSETILFHRDDDGDEQNNIWEIDLEGRASKLVEPDGQSILLDTDGEATQLYYVSDEAEQMNLYRYDFTTGETVQLTAYEQPVWGGMLSPTGDEIAYVTNESDDPANRDIYVSDAQNGDDARRLDIGDDGAQAQVADWHPDGGRLLIGDDTPDTPRVGIYDLHDDSVEWLGDAAYVERPSSFLPDGSGAIGWRIREAAYEPVIFLNDGTTRVFDLPTGVTSFPMGGHRHVFLDDERLLLANETPTTRRELFAYDLSSDQATRLTEAAYGSIDPEGFIDATYVTFESSDGLEIGGLLYDSGQRPSPAVVSVHGGPHTQSVRRFDLYTQFFLNRGFTVFQPNYRGSTGRGRAFKERIHHDWGGGEAEDIAAAGRWLASKDWIDDDRLIVYGGSYGGYSTYWQLVRYPDIWSTGIAWVGITDLLQLYEDSMPHFKSVLEEQLGDPTENEALYKERSPITHVEDIEAPILMVHGENDPRCPLNQAQRFHDALIERRGWSEGEDFVYEVLTEEGHGTTDLDQKVRAFNIIESYLDEWV